MRSRHFFSIIALTAVLLTACGVPAERAAETGGQVASPPELATLSPGSTLPGVPDSTRPLPVEGPTSSPGTTTDLPTISYDDLPLVDLAGIVGEWTLVSGVTVTSDGSKKVCVSTRRGGACTEDRVSFPMLLNVYGNQEDGAEPEPRQVVVATNQVIASITILDRQGPVCSVAADRSVPKLAVFVCEIPFDPEAGSYDLVFDFEDGASSRFLMPIPAR